MPEKMSSIGDDRVLILSIFRHLFIVVVVELFVVYKIITSII